MPVPVSAQVHMTLAFLHVLAVAIGLGAALMADWIVLTRITFAPVSARPLEFIVALSRAVTVGLIGLWVTGAALLALQWQQHSAALLANEKIWAKLLIVCFLTTNGFVLHRMVLPALARREGKALIGTRWFEALIPTATGAVSACSWLFAAYLGVARELNNVVSAPAVLTRYLESLVGIWMASLALAFLGHAIQSRQRRARENHGRPVPSAVASLPFSCEALDAARPPIPEARWLKFGGFPRTA